MARGSHWEGALSTLGSANMDVFVVLSTSKEFVKPYASKIKVVNKFFTADS